MTQFVKNPPAMQETWVRSLGCKDHLEKEMATHSNILVWEIPWTEGPAVIVHGVARVRHDLATKSPPGSHVMKGYPVQLRRLYTMFKSNPLWAGGAKT